MDITKIYKHGRRFQITYRMPGKSKVITEYFDKEEDAKRRIEDIALEKKTQSPTAVQTLTVEQMMELYVRNYGRASWSVGTLTSNRQRIRDFINPYIGKRNADMMTSLDYESYFALLLHEPAKNRTGKTVSATMVRKIRTLLQDAYKCCTRWGLLSSNPVAGTVAPKIIWTGTRNVWDQDEAYRAIQTCDDLLLKTILTVLIGSSMRIGELLALTWTDLHITKEEIEANRAYINVSKTLRRITRTELDELTSAGTCNIGFVFPSPDPGSKTLFALKPPKTRQSVRIIYIAKTVADQIAEYQRHKICDGFTDDYKVGLVFSQHNGYPLNASCINTSIQQYARNNEMREIVTHSLRHTSTSIKLRISNGDIKSVQADTGHATASMVTNVYAHADNSARKALACDMEHKFFSNENGRN